MRRERLEGSAWVQWERASSMPLMAVVVVLTLVCLARVGLGAHLTQSGRRTQALEKQHAELAEYNARLTTEFIRKSSATKVRERLAASGVRVVAGGVNRAPLPLPAVTGVDPSARDVASRVSRAVADAGRSAWPDGPHQLPPRAVAWARGR